MGFRPLGYANGGNIGSVAAAAPPGHFPAYITSDEAGMLRSQGGGVAPDGGQYMANGLPAFFGGADDSPDTDGSSASPGSTGDPSSPGDESGNIGSPASPGSTGDPSNPGDESGNIGSTGGTTTGQGPTSTSSDTGIVSAIQNFFTPASVVRSALSLVSPVFGPIGLIGQALNAAGATDPTGGSSDPTAGNPDNADIGGPPDDFPVRSSPVQSSPVQSSPVQSSPRAALIDRRAPLFGADNPLFASNPQDFTATNLDPFRFTTSPAVSASGAFKDGGMIGYRPPGYANGGMSDDGTWAPGYANGGAMGFRPLGYANGGMPRGYADGDAVHTQIKQAFKEQLVNQNAAKLSEWIYQRLPDLEQAAKTDRAFAEQLGVVMNTIGFDKYMEELIAASPPAPGTLPPPSPPQQMPPPMLGQPGQYERLPAQMPQIPQQIPDMPTPMLQQERFYGPPVPEQPIQQMPPGMNRGGIMSLRHM
jgi:hypothetical protein